MPICRRGEGRRKCCDHRRCCETERTTSGPRIAPTSNLQLAREPTVPVMCPVCPVCVPAPPGVFLPVKCPGSPPVFLPVLYRHSSCDKSSLDALIHYILGEIRTGSPNDETLWLPNKEMTKPSIPQSPHLLQCQRASRRFQRSLVAGHFPPLPSPERPTGSRS